MNNLYVISGVTGMTGSELARQLLKVGHSVIGFDNFFASSLDSIHDVIDSTHFHFFEYDLNNDEQMDQIKKKVLEYKNDFLINAYIFKAGNRCSSRYLYKLFNFRGIFNAIMK